MKTRLLIIIAVFLVLISGIGSWTGTAEEMPDSIDGFVISNPQGDVRQYPIDKLDEMPCEDFMSIFHLEMLKTEQRTLISEKLTICLKDSSGHTVTYENTSSNLL